MKFFLMANPKQYEKYARFSHLGTWVDDHLCAGCGQSTARLAEPLVLEWEPDSDVIGDFSWCGYTAVVKEDIGNYFIDSGFDCKLGSVEVVAPSSKRRGKKRVAHPYVGPAVKWLISNLTVPLNKKKSGLELLIDCKECQQTKYSFKQNGLYIDSSKWRGEKIFHIEDYTRSSAMFVTENAVDIIKSANISNVEFIEAGKIELERE